MNFRCSTCQILLTENLEELNDKKEIDIADGKPLVPKGFYFVGNDQFYSGAEGKYLINPANLINAKNHNDKIRTNGCCGLDGLDGLNKICINGHELGTEKSDCWMPHAVIFESGKVKTDN